VAPVARVADAVRLVAWIKEDPTMRTVRHALALACLLATLPVHWSRAVDRAGSAPRPDPPPAPARTLAGPVYRCTEGGITVLADRPCSAGLTDARYFALRTPPAPGEQPSTTSRVAPPARMHAAKIHTPTRSGATDTTCQRLRQRLDSLDDRMRLGYPAREAGRLLDQRRGLKQGLREAGC
jgi:hypothetical protein